MKLYLIYKYKWKNNKPDGLSISNEDLVLFVVDCSTKSNFRVANGLLGLFDSQSRLIFDTLPIFNGKSVGRLLYRGAVDLGYCNDRRIVLTRLHWRGSASSSDNWSWSKFEVKSSVETLRPRSILTYITIINVLYQIEFIASDNYPSIGLPPGLVTNGVLPRSLFWSKFPSVDCTSSIANIGDVRSAFDVFKVVRDEDFCTVLERTTWIEPDTVLACRISICLCCWSRVPFGMEICWESITLIYYNTHKTCS